MLKLKYLFENYDLAKEALKNWQHKDENIDEALAHYRISSNAIYPFFDEEGLCFLRLAPTSEKYEQNIQGEIEFINYLIKNGYNAMKPVPSLSGKTLLKLSTAWGEYYASVFRSVAGQPIEDTDMSPKIMNEYGKALGKLHTLSEEYVPKTAKWSYEDALNWVQDVFSKYKAKDCAVAELNELRNKLGMLSKDKKSYGLVHYDFETDNVFYDKNTLACYVIDFDDGMYNWFVLDIDQTLDSVKETFEDKGFTEEKFAEAKESFLEGYKSEHELTKDMIDLMPLMRRFINLFGYARLIRCVDEKFENEPEWLVYLRKKLSRVINELEKSMEVLHEK